MEKTYLENANDSLPHLVRENDGKKMYSIQKEADKFSQEFDLHELPKEGNDPAKG